MNGDKTAGTLSPIKAEAQTVPQYFTTTCSQLIKNKVISPNNILDEVVKNINLIKSQPLNTCVFNIRDKIERVRKPFSWIRRKKLMQLNCKLLNLLFHSWNTIFI